MVNHLRVLKLALHPFTMMTIISLAFISYQYIDLKLTIHLLSAHLEQKHPILNTITQFGNGTIILVFFMGGLFFRFIYIKKTIENLSWLLSLSIFISGLVCFFMKILFGRARPWMWGFSQEYGFYGITLNPNYWSFPSGHTSTILSIFCCLYIFFPRYWFLFLLSSLVVSLSRLLLGWHYLSDIIIAGYLSFLEVLFIYSYLIKKSWFIFEKK